MFLRLCLREHRVALLHAISPISMKLWQFKGSTQNSKRQSSWLFPGGYRIYEALTTMVFNQLLWESHIITSLVNVWRKYQSIWSTLVNQQWQINDCVFRLFDSSKYLTTLRSNISPCQKATTLILITLYNPSFHLWKSSKKSLGTTVFLSWMPFKICDCDKFLSTKPVTQFWL